VEDGINEIPKDGEGGRKFSLLSLVLQGYREREIKVIWGEMKRRKRLEIKGKVSGP